ncbi:hypothetical protein QYE76_024757 [Lolium multiflorum]|uniref:Uncharacterized protein n=1 Tax=Lolium multiflorum TaxID=4521 RepID=A0AAD8REA0_LOLMU|nr:hypothetical protein QYE76_024757 [Lolium multiflorum]
MAVEVRWRVPAPHAAPRGRGTGEKGRVQAGDALPLPIRHTNLIFSVLFAASLAYQMRRWREKIHTSTPLHVVGLTEIFAIYGLIASLIYLLSFFGIAFVQSVVSNSDNEEEDFLIASAQAPPHKPKPQQCALLQSAGAVPEKMPEEDEEIVVGVVAGKIPSYVLETRLLADRTVAAGFHVGAGIPGVAPHYIPPPSTFNVLLGSYWNTPPGLEAMLKEFISTQTAFNKSVEEKLNKIDILASKVDSLASDVDLLKSKVMPNKDIENKIVTTANAIQVRINENIRLMAELHARWEREENEKLAKENNVAKVWTITTTSNANAPHVAAPPTNNGERIGVGNVSTSNAKPAKLPETAKTAETAVIKLLKFFPTLGMMIPLL